MCSREQEGTFLLGVWGNMHTTVTVDVHDTICSDDRADALLNH
jgi:hypothetical protein